MDQMPPEIMREIIRHLDDHSKISLALAMPHLDLELNLQKENFSPEWQVIMDKFQEFLAACHIANNRDRGL